MGTIKHGDEEYSGSPTMWGYINGTLSDQTDLKLSLDGKYDTVLANKMGAKNFLSTPYNLFDKMSPYTIDGLTFTYYEDGSVNIDGVATASGNTDVHRRVPNNDGSDLYLSPNKYRFYCNVEGGYYAGITYGGSFVEIGSTGATASSHFDFEITKNMNCDYKKGNDVLVAIYIYYSNGQVFNDVTLYPMIVLQDTTDTTWVPYSMTNKQLTDKKYDKELANVLGAKNLFNVDASRTVTSNTTCTRTTNGINVSNSSAGTWKMVYYPIDLLQNTDYIVTSDVSVSSGTAMIAIEGVTSGGTNTNIKDSVALTSDGKIELSFNTGNSYVSYRVIFFCTLGTGALGDVTYNYPMLRFALDTDDTYEPYATTNRDLSLNKCDNSVIAPLEPYQRASRAYAIGEHFIRYGAFCTAKTAIASNDLLTNGTNYREGDLNDILEWQFLDWYNITTTERTVNIPSAREWLFVVGAKNSEQVYGGRSYVIPRNESVNNIIETGQLFNAGGTLISNTGVRFYVNNNNQLIFRALDIITGELIVRVYYRK